VRIREIHAKKPKLRKEEPTMKERLKNRLAEALIAALTAFLTALTTVSCMGYIPAL
jgi:hypothetical protein